MKIPKKLNLADKGSVLILAFMFLVIAPIYYASVHPHSNDSYATPVKQQIQQTQETTAPEEKPPTNAVTEDTPQPAASSTVAPKPEQTSSSPAQSNPAPKAISRPDKCSGLNKSFGDKYLRELSAIRSEKQKLYDAIIGSILNFNKSQKINNLNQDTYSKELGAYKSYISQVKSANCTPAGYSAP